MDLLLEDLLQRWTLAFDELDSLSQRRSEIRTVQYADSFRYDLGKFDRNSFPSGGPLTTDKGQITPFSPHEYGFNDKGLPCYTTFGHDHNQIFWEGYYCYTDDLVEFVEFCLTSGIPSAIQRIKYQNGRKISWQSMSINGRGTGYSRSSMSKEEIINRIKNEGFSLIYTVTSFQYDPSGKIEKAFSNHKSSGIGEYTSYDEYAYDKNGELDTIRTFFEKGSNRLTYCRVPENTDPESLMDELAANMAQAVLAALASAEIEEPIALLELSYHYADNYYPLLVYQSAQEVEDALENEDFSFTPTYYDDAVSVDRSPFERLFAQLGQMMEERDDMQLGRRMLRKTAELLTTYQLFGEIAVTDDFAAFAIDWSIEEHSEEHFQEILLECGVEPAHLEFWRKKGLFR